MSTTPAPSESTALAIPDPRSQPVPVGWAESFALPVILETEDWESLDEYEAVLKAYASYIDAFEGDVVEFEKALRVLEKRRGDLVGDDQRTSSHACEDVSPQTVTRWRKIARHWDELWPLVRDAKKRGEVTQAALLRIVERANVQADAGPLPEGEFRVIAADPPWRYDNKATRGAAEDHYGTMSMDELYALQVPAADNAHLYLWVTNGMMREGLDLCAAWGFEYKALLTWVKPQIGLGNYFRNATEHVIFGLRGKLPTNGADIPTWFKADRTRHSQKPDSFYDLVEKASPGPYLEMFARRQRLGWSTWGNEALEHVEVAA